MLPRLDRSYPKCVKNLEKHAKNEPTYKTSKRNSRPRGRIYTRLAGLGTDKGFLVSGETCRQLQH